MASEALRMIINLEVDESLRSNYKTYQQQQPPLPPQNDTDNIFPQQIKMFPWNDIQQITQYIYEQTQIPTQHQRLFFRGREITAYHRHKLQRSSNRSTPRNNHNHHNKKRKKLSSPTLAFFGITHESTIYLQCKSANDEIPIVPYGYCSVLLTKIKTSNNNKLLIEQCINGLYDDMRPILSSDGEGGTYFLRNSNNEKIACFKPSDEEAGCINNPRGRTDTQQAMHCGIKPSEGHLREIAAYLIDNNPKYQKISGFHNVPPTMRVEIAYNGFHYNSPQKPTPTPSPTEIDYEPLSPKIGALQKFIKGEVIENFGVKNFAIREVHKIGILDIRILNCDRNSGNVLVSKDEFNGRYELIPIDHGLSLPEKIEITRDSWVWLNWDQSKQPFDPYTIEYINNIDIDHDIQHLKSELNFPQIVFENMRISNLVLKKGANKGLTLHEIGSIIARPDFDTKSILEELMLQAEILAIEKCRQNKHLINRIKLKRRKSIERNIKTHRHSQHLPTTPQQPHIVQKFIDKGIPLKTPLLPRSNTLNHTSTNNMVYVPSLAPPSSSRHDKNGHGVGLKTFQVLNTSNNHSNTPNVIFPGSPVIPLSSTNSMKLSPNPSKLATSTSLGSGALSITPEPFALYHPSSSSSNHNRPKALIIHKVSSGLNKTESNPSTDDIDADDTSFVVPFWTPNYRAQSSISQQSSNPNLYPRSATPDRRNRNKSPQMPPFMLHPETPPAPNPIYMLTKARKTADESQRVLRVDVDLQKQSESDTSQQSNKESADHDILYSPLQIQFMEKTSSIHDRDGSTILNDKGHSANLNTIFKSISAATNDTAETAESDSVNDTPIVPEIEEDDNNHLLFSKIQPQLELNDDDDDEEREEEDEKKQDKELILTSFSKTPIGLGINETEDNYDRLYENKPKPFSSLRIDTMTSNSTISTKAATSKSATNSNSKTTAEMVPLSRSTSCIDVRKSDVRKSSTFSLNSVDSNKNLMSSTTNQTSNPLIQSQRVSMDDDSIFLYNTDEIKSASLINHSSMLEKRKEMMALQNDDSNSSRGSAEDHTGNNNNTSRSYTEMSVPASVLTAFALDQKVTTDSPSNSNHVLNIINNKSGTNSNQSVHTPSNTSQDDMIRPKDHGFVIHPIMERMAKENQEVKKWFMYYLDQLLGIQCERILNRSRKNDNRDNIYDIDTVHGSFIWKNELRKHWVRSRLERKKLMAQLPPKNPFVDSIQFINKDEGKEKKSKLVKPKLINAKTNPVRSVSQNPWMNDELVDDDEEDDDDDDDHYHNNYHDESEQDEDEEDNFVDIDNQETINYIDLKKKSDEDEETNMWFGMERPQIDTDQED